MGHGRRGPGRTCIGDFNEIPDQLKKGGGLPKDQSKIDKFNGLINDLSLIDLGFKGSKYTWCNNRQGHDRVRERLDRTLSNIEWVTTFPTS